MDERLEAWAAARGGVFTSGQAAACEIGPSALARLRARGEVVRVRRDAYVLGDRWLSATPEQRLALRTRAVLATRGSDVASHQSALALHGLPLHRAPLDVVDVHTDVERTRSATGLRRHPTPPGLDAVVADGYRCVRVEQAIAQVAVRSGMLAALVPLDAALHRGLLAVDDLERALSDHGGTERLRARGALLLARSDPACESPGETLTRSMLLDAGFEVLSQVVVHDAEGMFVGRVDLVVGERVLVEFDGAVKYAGAHGSEALRAEKHREDALRELGYAVVRVTWADLQRPGAVVAKVRRALAGLSARGRETSVS